MITPDRLEQIEQRLNGLTKYPWILEHGQYSGSNWLVASICFGSTDGKNYWIHITTDHVPASQLGITDAKNDAEFMVNAPQDVADLITEVKRLQVQNEQLKHEIKSDLVDRLCTCGYLLPSISNFFDPEDHNPQCAYRIRIEAEQWENTEQSRQD